MKDPDTYLTKILQESCKQRLSCKMQDPDTYLTRIMQDLPQVFHVLVMFNLFLFNVAILTFTNRSNSRILFCIFSPPYTSLTTIPWFFNLVEFLKMDLSFSWGSWLNFSANFSAGFEDLRRSRPVKNLRNYKTKLVKKRITALKYIFE